jgi:hypothetical protein
MFLTLISSAVDCLLPEPNQLFHAYHHNVSANQLAADYKLLKRLLQKFSSYKNSILVGPAVTQPKQKSLSYLSRLACLYYFLLMLVSYDS